MIAPVYYLLSFQDDGHEVTQRLRAEATSISKTLEENITSLINLVESYAKQRPRYTDLYWNEFPMIVESKMNNSLEVSIYNHIDSLKFIYKGLYDLVAPLTERWDRQELEDDNAFKKSPMKKKSHSNEPYY